MSLGKLEELGVIRVVGIKAKVFNQFCCCFVGIKWHERGACVSECRAALVLFRGVVDPVGRWTTEGVGLFGCSSPFVDSVGIEETLFAGSGGVPVSLLEGGGVDSQVVKVGCDVGPEGFCEWVAFEGLRRVGVFAEEGA